MSGVEHLNGFEIRLRQMKERGEGDVNSAARRLCEAFEQLRENFPYSALEDDELSSVEIMLSAVEMRMREVRQALDEHEAMRGLRVEIDRCTCEGR